MLAHSSISAYSGKFGISHMEISDKIPLSHAFTRSGTSLTKHLNFSNTLNG